MARDLSEWEAASAQTMGPSETHTIMNVPSSYFTSPVGTRFDSDARFDYNEPLERFARNEIAYDEFMQMTGKQANIQYFFSMLFVLKSVVKYLVNKSYTFTRENLISETVEYIIWQIYIVVFFTLRFCFLILFPALCAE